ncbi:MAG: sugar phosphate nucleotidyltransferase [Candidatus Gorgyraea atricola]|nr:sugar phosphate nucleotidyltransferase [Candidatus Gorgyraea atricola]
MAMEAWSYCVWVMMGIRKVYYIAVILMLILMLTSGDAVCLGSLRPYMQLEKGKNKEINLDKVSLSETEEVVEEFDNLVRLNMNFEPDNEKQDYGSKPRSMLIQLVNDWRNWESNERRILDLSCHLLGIENILEFKTIRPIKPIILAGGRGSRANNKAKVLERVDGKSTIMHILNNILILKKSNLGFQIEIEKPLIVVNYENAELIANALKGYEVEYFIEEKPLGTGKGVLETEELTRDFKGDVLVYLGARPCVYTPSILKSILIHQAIEFSSMTLITTVVKKPYAPLVRDPENSFVIDSVETHLEKAKAPPIGESNIGVYLVRKQDLYWPLHEAHNELYNAADNTYKWPGELGFVNQMVRRLAAEDRLVISLPLANTEEGSGIRFAGDSHAMHISREHLLTSIKSIAPRYGL